MARTRCAPLVTRTGFDPRSCPLVVAQRPQPADAGWATLTAAVSEHACGLVFVLEHPAEMAAESSPPSPSPSPSPSPPPPRPRPALLPAPPAPRGPPPARPPRP